MCKYLLPNFRSSIHFCSVLSTFPVYSVFSCSRFLSTYGLPRAPLEVQVVKKLPAVQEAQVQSLGWEDPLGEGNGNPLSFLAWRIPQTKKPGRLLLVLELRGVRHA